LHRPLAGKWAFVGFAHTLESLTHATWLTKAPSAPACWAAR